MAFGKLPGERERWQRFCEQHRELLAQLSRIEVAFRAPSHFEELLQFGSTSVGGENASLQSLSDTEWDAFHSFVLRYSESWETYFVETLYPAYFREAERRGVPHGRRRST